MAKLFILLVFVGVYFGSSASTSIECDFKIDSWNIIKSFYICEVNLDPNIKTQESAAITSISGNHQSRNSNSDVTGFSVRDKTCHYFPRGLETFFKNIKAFRIAYSNLKEVHQEDLKPFPKLVEILLYTNSLEILEAGLFNFNSDLEYIYFATNKIVHIEPKIFDHLSKLSSLDLRANTCINKYAHNSISEVNNLIQTAKVQCISSELILRKTSDLATKFESISDLMIKVSSDINELKSSQIILKEVKGSFDGFGSTLNSLKTGQSSIAGSINQVCTKESLNQVLSNQQNILNFQNEMKILMDEIKVNKDEDADDKFKLFGDKIEGQLTNFKAENVEKFAHIEKELTSTRHKIAVTIDEKIKGIEKRLMKKFEDVLEEKLARFIAK